MANVPEDMIDTLLKIIDKLAGKQSKIKLSFQDLVLDLDMAKSKLNGSIVLEIGYPTETPALASKKQLS